MTPGPLCVAPGQLVALAKAQEEGALVEGGALGAVLCPHGAQLHARAQRGAAPRPPVVLCRVALHQL
jgi:hypothetical protein